MKLIHVIIGAGLLFSSTAQATIINVVGGNSSLGTAPTEIAAPANALDDMVTNTGMQGFDEAQNVVTTVAFNVDGGTLAAGSFVDSHMIFLNSAGDTRVTHENVIWTFAGKILAIISGNDGADEVASTGELGAPGTNYTTPGPGTGPAPPFTDRGMESPIGGSPYTNDGSAGQFDRLALIGLNSLKVSMLVTEPGDWIRVITAAVPVPAAIWLFGTALIGFIGFSRRRMVA